ncbi:MAG TPA: DUF2088 domain-containing protein [Phycisphaerales bacterium]|nr:DUF2088 domain-containing protein [Phycisphaerales bacterium]
MKVNIHYGDGHISLDIPDENVARVIQPFEDGPQTDNGEIVGDALGEREVENFKDRIDGKQLCVLVGDGTRDMPLDSIFDKLFCILSRGRFVKFVICTGTHNGDTYENKKIIERINRFAADAGLSDFEIHVHDHRNAEFINAGTTSCGTDIIYNAVIADADVFLILSDVKSHYFAGYSNPIKNFVPGICAYATAEANHSLALNEKSSFGIHPWHNDKSRRENPLAMDQLEGMKLITGDREVHAFVTISSSRRIQWVGFGLAEDVCGRAFDESDRLNATTVEPVDRLIVSPGGLPNDVDLYIAQRALELTKAAVTDGGEVLFLAACPKGVGEEHTRENFYDRLTRPIPEILSSIESKYALYSHKPYKFAVMIENLRRLWVYSEIPDDMMEAAHLYPTNNPQTVVDAWLAENPDTKIMIVDGANKIAIHAG